MVQISVIIPVYNAEKYISDALDSILSQTFIDFEIICVNDGSTDSTLNLLKQYAIRDRRVKLINQTNSGVSKARNNAFEQAKGKYIYYMDSDDIIHPQLLEICFNLAEKLKADVISFGYDEFFDNKKPSFNEINEEAIHVEKIDNFIAKIISKGDLKINYNIWSKFFAKKELQNIKFNEEISLAEDILHTFSVAKNNPKTFIFKDKLYAYRVCKNSLSHGGYNVKQIQGYSKCIKAILEMHKTDENSIEILKKDFIPNILKHQVGRCRRASRSKQSEMRYEFLHQLNYLNNLGMLDKKYHRKKIWKFISLLLEKKIFKLSILGFTFFSINLNNKICIGK